MNRHTFVRAFVAAACVGSVLGVPLGFAIVWADRMFPEVHASCR